MFKNSINIISLVLLLITTSFISSATALSADTTIFNTPGYEASISDLGGATVNQIDANTVQLQLNDTRNSYTHTILWNQLNTPAGKTLDFKFSDKVGFGQTCLNKVQTGISRFAGTITTSGGAGRLIISNPNGMIFENGSLINTSTNGSSLFLTTHDFDPSSSATPTRISDNGIYMNGATIKVGRDLVLHSTGINIQNSNILANNTASLYTLDGIHYSFYNRSEKGNIRQSYDNQYYTAPYYGYPASYTPTTNPVAAADINYNDASVNGGSNDIFISNTKFSNLDRNGPSSYRGMLFAGKNVELKDTIFESVSNSIVADSLKMTNIKVPLDSTYGTNNYFYITGFDIDIDRMDLAGTLQLGGQFNAKITNSDLDGVRCGTYTSWFRSMKPDGSFMYRYSGLEFNNNIVRNDFATGYFVDDQDGSNWVNSIQNSLDIANSIFKGDTSFRSRYVNVKNSTFDGKLIATGFGEGSRVLRDANNNIIPDISLADVFVNDTLYTYNYCKNCRLSLERTTALGGATHEDWGRCTCSSGPFDPNAGGGYTGPTDPIGPTPIPVTPIPVTPTPVTPTPVTPTQAATNDNDYNVTDVDLLASIAGKRYNPATMMKVKGFAAPETQGSKKSLVKITNGFRVIKKVY